MASLGDPSSKRQKRTKGTPNPTSHAGQQQSAAANGSRNDASGAQSNPPRHVGLLTSGSSPQAALAHKRSIALPSPWSAAHAKIQSLDSGGQLQQLQQLQQMINTMATPIIRLWLGGAQPQQQLLRDGQYRDLLLKLIEMLPSMGKDVQEKAVVSILEFQILPLLTKIKHQAPPVEHTNGYHCSQFKLYQPQRAPSFLPGLRALIAMFKNGFFSRQDVQRLFREYAMPLGYLQSMTLHEYFPYDDDYRCGLCLKPGEILPCDMLRFMHVKACGNMAAGGLNSKKGIASNGTSYTENHYGIAIGTKSTPESVVKKIMPATSFQGNVWRMLKKDPELATYLKLLWPIECETPKNMPEGMGMWRTASVWFEKPTFVDMRYSIDADNDIVMKRVAGELLDVEECERACNDMEATLKGFTEQMRTDRRQREGAANMKPGGLGQGKEFFIDEFDDPVARIEALEGLEGEDDSEEMESAVGYDAEEPREAAKSIQTDENNGTHESITSTSALLAATDTPAALVSTQTPPSVPNLATTTAARRAFHGMELGSMSSEYVVGESLLGSGASSKPPVTGPTVAAGKLPAIDEEDEAGLVAVFEEAEGDSAQGGPVSPNAFNEWVVNYGTPTEFELHPKTDNLGG